LQANECTPLILSNAKAFHLPDRPHVPTDSVKHVAADLAAGTPEVKEVTRYVLDDYICATAGASNPAKVAKSRFQLSNKLCQMLAASCPEHESLETIQAETCIIRCIRRLMADANFTPENWHAEVVQTIKTPPEVAEGDLGSVSTWVSRVRRRWQLILQLTHEPYYPGSSKHRYRFSDASKDLARALPDWLRQDQSFLKRLMRKTSITTFLDEIKAEVQSIQALKKNNLLLPARPVPEAGSAFSARGAFAANAAAKCNWNGDLDKIADAKAEVDKLNRVASAAQKRSVRLRCNDKYKIALWKWHKNKITLVMLKI